MLNKPQQNVLLMRTETPKELNYSASPLDIQASASINSNNNNRGAFTFKNAVTMDPQQDYYSIPQDSIFQNLKNF